MKMIPTAALLASFVCLVGCGKTITMVYHSNPEGAVIIQNNASLGHAPVSAKYKAPPEFNAGGCATISETAALWASGAQAIVPQITACKTNTYLQNITFQRPDVPGAELDVATANAQQATRNADQQATRDANTDALINAAGQLGGMIGTEIGRH